MKDFDSIWRTQDEIRTVVNAVLGECIWDLDVEQTQTIVDYSLLYVRYVFQVFHVQRLVMNIGLAFSAFLNPQDS